MSLPTPQIVVPQLVVAGASGLQIRQMSDALAANHWTIVHRDPRGRIIEIDYMQNIVVTAGLNKYLDATLKTGLTTPAWYLGLTDGTPTVAPGDVMSSHAGWTEVTAYDEATRVVWTPGTIAAGSVSNSASQARFTISSNSTTIGGAFIVDENTKSGTTGTLLAAGAFTAADKTLDDDDTLDVTLTATQAAA